MVPAGTPQPVIEKIAGDVGRIISAPAFVDRYMTQMGNELINGDAARFRTMMAQDAKLLSERTASLSLQLDF
jgi:hypothetical protein